MSDTRRQLRMLPRRLAALVLTLWLAGFGCLLGCEARPSSLSFADAHAAEAVEAVESAAETTESCAAMSGGHGCCRPVAGRAETRKATKHGAAKHRAARRAEAVREATELDARSLRAGGSPGGTHARCCSMTGQTIDAARKFRVADAPVTAARAARPRAPESDHFTSFHPASARVPDRGGTHLRCCVFLI